jgi:trimeric autotransporter adhesin
MKKIILLLLMIITGGFLNLFSQTVCTYEKGYSDFPFTSSGITFSLSGTGSFTSYGSAYTHCAITTKANSIYIGNGVGTFTITTSQYVNDMVYNLTCMDPGEVITITVSNGTPTAAVTDGACLTTTNNVISNSTSAVAGGRFKVHSSSSYNTITFSHNGSGGGSLVTMCVDAVFESVKPTVSTTAVSSVTGTTASSGGNVTADGGSSVTARGVCWNTSTAPTISNNFTSDGTSTGTFTSSVTGLTLGTTYYLRAYATNANGTAYGNEVSFTTISASVPTLSTTSASSITSSGASSGGNISADGGASVTARGVCWSTSAGPTTSNSKTIDGTGTGSFTSSITGLTAGNLYYVRAYATNTAGTGYGNEISFTALKNTQTITFGSMAVVTYGVADIDPGASSTSGLTVTYSSSNLSVATIVSNKVHIVGTGTVTIYADQAGNINWSAAPQVSRLLTINTKNLSVTGATASNKIYDGNTTAALTGGTLSGVVGSDVVSLANNTTGTFASSGVGTGISVTSAMTLSGAAAGNYTLTQPTLSANITVKTLTVTGATATNKVYDGNTTASITSGSLSGVVGSDVVTLANNTTGTFSTATVGTAKTVTSAMTLTGAAAGNYTLTQPTLSANITAKTLTVTGASATNKVYDGNTTAAITGGSLSGVVGSDVVSLANNTTGTFTSSGVGTGIGVTSAMTLSGSAAGNYTLTQPTLSANITAKTLTVTGASATNKVYDGNTTAAITGGSLSGVVGSDVVSLANNTTGTFASSGVGTGISVTSAMTLSGAAAGNYTLTQPALSANITVKTLTVTGATATNKVYDGNTTAAISGGSLSGVVGSDVVTLANNTTGTFSTATVGTAKTVTSAMTLTGAAAGNYTLTQPTLSANITAKTLTVTGASATNKVYDGNTTAAITGGSLSGVVGSDVVSLANNTTGTFASSGVGTGIGVTSAMTLSGAAAGNYTLTQPTLSANITAKTLTVTGASATNKVYDGNTTAAITGGTLSGVVGSDVVSLANNTSGTFASSGVGTGISVTSAMTLSGAAAGNYTLTQPTLSANITVKTLTVTGATATNKVYDGNTTASITGGSLSGIVGSDVVTLANNTTGTFSTTTVGTGKTVTSSMTITGAAAANYTLTQPSLSANITVKTLTVTGATANSKIYDGNTNATITGGTLSGIVGSDVVTLANNTTGIFASPNLGTGIAVTTAMTLSGAAAGNYTLTQPTLFADITNKLLTVTGATAADKIYDGNTNAIIIGGTLNGIVGSDVVTLSNNTTGTFATSNAGTAIQVTTSMTITGADAAAYTLVQPTLSANITTKNLTITGAAAEDKVYDGTTSATITGGTIEGIVGSDDVSLVNYTTGTFATATVGIAKTVTSAMTLTGTTAGNYTLTQPALSADITVKPLSVTGATANNKIYDGNTNATVSGGILTGVVGSDDVTLANSTTGTFASPNLGTGISVTTSMTLSGSAAGNYSLIQPSLIADITNKLLTVTGATASNKVYDGNTSAVITGGTLSGIVGSDVVTLANNTTGEFTSANTGTGIPVTTSMTIEGADAGLYTLVQPSLTADITPKSLTATADNKSKVTGQTNPALTISYSGFITGETSSDITAPAISTTAVTGSPTGSYPILLSGGSAANYSISLVNGVLTVNKAVLTITADNKNKVYGSVNPSLTLSYSGFVNGDDASSITAPTPATTATSGSVAGVYPITLTGGSASDYTLTLVEGTLTIDKAVLTVTADNKNREYGSSNPDLTLSYSGFVNGDNESALSLKPALATAANMVSGVGTYSIIPSGGSADNYSFTYVNGTLTVTKKMLTVTAENKTRLVNQSDPVFTMTYTGFAGNEGISSITTLPVASTTAVLSSPAGLYPIIPGGGTADNYDFTYINGSLQISTMAGDANGDGKITPPEIAGDSNNDGIIDGTEIAGDTNGDGKIDGTEIAGDTNGDGQITGSEIAGDVNGDGKISGAEIAGDSNGDGSITGIEIAGDTNGDHKIAGTEISGDVNGDGKISGNEIVGDTNGDGKVTGTEVAGDSNGDGKIAGTEVAGDTNGDGKITGSELAGDTNGDGQISGSEIAGDSNGDGKVSGTEIAGDTNGDGKITGTEIAGDTNGDGSISSTEVMGDTNGDGSIGGNEVSGDQNGDGSIGTGESRVFDPQKDFPNINHLFTPNNDGINDYWILPDLEKYGITDVKVYNRWGKLVYSKKNYDNLWDGTSDGSNLPDGAYYYIIKTEKAGTISGTVNILR